MSQQQPILDGIAAVEKATVRGKIRGMLDALAQQPGGAVHGESCGF